VSASTSRAAGLDGVDAAAVGGVRGAARRRDLEDDQAFLRDGGLEPGRLADDGGVRPRQGREQLLETLAENLFLAARGDQHAALRRARL